RFSGAATVDTIRTALAAPDTASAADPADADPHHPDDPQPDDAQPGDLLTTNPGLAAALLGGGIIGGAGAMAAIGAARPARVLQVVPTISPDTLNGPLVPSPDRAAGTPAPGPGPGLPTNHPPGNHRDLGGANGPATLSTGNPASTG